MLSHLTDGEVEAKRGFKEPAQSHIGRNDQAAWLLSTASLAQGFLGRGMDLFFHSCSFWGVLELDCLPGVLVLCLGEAGLRAPLGVS